MKKNILNLIDWDLPGGLVAKKAKTLHSQCKGPGFNPWSDVDLDPTSRN